MNPANRAGRQTEIHVLLQAGDCKRLYQECAAAIREMLFLETAGEFEDFWRQEGGLDETILLLYDAAVSGESLLIGGYEEDVTGKVRAFLQARMPKAAFSLLQEDLQDLYVDLGTRDTLESRIAACNRSLQAADYKIVLQFEETYCAGAYFLSVESL